MASKYPLIGVRTPILRRIGKKITIELLDSLLPDRTYTIDFADIYGDADAKVLVILVDQEEAAND